MSGKVFPLFREIRPARTSAALGKFPNLPPLQAHYTSISLVQHDKRRIRPIHQTQVFVVAKQKNCRYLERKQKMMTRSVIVTLFLVPVVAFNNGFVSRKETRLRETKVRPSCFPRSLCTCAGSQISFLCFNYK